MAKIRRTRELSRNSGEEARAESSSQYGFEGYDLFIYAGLMLLTLVVPFLYSRLTTENFLTPKEFVSRIGLAFLGWQFFMYWAYKYARDGRTELVRTRFDLPLAAFFGFCVLSLLWNYNIPSAIRDLRTTFLLMMGFILIVNNVRSRWQFDGLLWMVVVTGLATSTLGIMEAYNIYFRWDPTSGWFVFARDEIFKGQIDYSAFYVPLFPQLADPNYSMSSIVSTFGNRNYLGTFAMFTAFLPLAFYFYYEKPLMKGISLFLFAWMLMGLYITRCRAALGGVVIGVLFMSIVLAWFDRYRKWEYVRKNRIFFLAVLFIFVLGFLVSVTTVKSTSVSMLDKLRNTFTMDRTKSNVYERIWVWYATTQSFVHSPVRWMIGNGYGSFKHFFPLQEAASFDDENKETFTPVTFRQAHNEWLQLVSELGLIGLGLFLWICFRFYAAIFRSIRAAAYGEESGGLKGEHVVLVSLGAAMTAQLVASIPDFPFHRIETAFYAVIVLGLVPTVAESQFFTRPIRTTSISNRELVIAVFIVATLGGVFAMRHEWRCWTADTYVRHAEALLGQRPTPEGVAEAKDKLLKAIQMDPLPGDPYLKVASILEMENKPEEAMAWAERAWQNINFNARSTYHSVVFRMMHIAYHLQKDKAKAIELGLRGQYMTAGDARSIYYFYIGKIAMEVGDLARAEWALRRCLNYPAFATQAGANLAVVLASMQKWEDALSLAASISRQVNDGDPTILDILGISASNVGQYATAETALRKAVGLNPNQPVYKRDLGVTLLRMQRTPEAKKLLEEAIEMGGLPANVKAETEGMLASIAVAYRDQGNQFFKQDKRPEAIALWREAFGSKHLPAAMKAELEQQLRQAGGFQAEQAPAPAGVLEAASAALSVPVVVPPAPGASPAVGTGTAAQAGSAATAANSAVSTAPAGN